MHTIRLRGPWEQQPQDGGLVRYLRRFHRPTGLEGGARVWLVVEASAEIALNDTALGASPGRFDVTELLAHRNTLVVTTAGVLATDSLARLEIG